MRNMSTMSCFCRDELLKQANATLRVHCAKLGHLGAVRIQDSGISTFEPRVNWMGIGFDGSDAETTAEFAKVLELASRILEAMPAKGAKVAY